MADLQLRLFVDNAGFVSDLALDGARFALDGGLETAVLLSLFTDARATDEEMIRHGLNPADDHRGWWGNLIPPLQVGEGERWQLGSKLWLLKREKQTESTRQWAQIYAAESLSWMPIDGVADRVETSAEWLHTPDLRGKGWLAIGASIYRPLQPAARYRVQWNQQMNRLRGLS